LEAVPQMGPYVFPSRIEGGTIFKGWGKCKARFDAELEGVEPYTLHDLRRTFASTLARLGTPIHVTEKLLNHISGTVSGVAAIYNRHSYMDEMREAIAAYESHLVKLIGE
jgi:integrase